MTELRFTDTNAADDSVGRAFGLDGNLYLPLVIGMVAAVGIFAGTGLLGIGYGTAGLLGIVPLVIVSVWVLVFRHGKPRGYDRDRLDMALGRGDSSPCPDFQPQAKSHDRAPDGRFVNGFILFGSPERGGAVAKGYRLEPPDLRGASITRLNAFQDQMRALLALVGPGRRLQFQWSCDSDYRAELLRYHERTQTASHAENCLMRCAAHCHRRSLSIVFVSLKVASL